MKSNLAKARMKFPPKVNENELCLREGSGGTKTMAAGALSCRAISSGLCKTQTLPDH